MGMLSSTTSCAKNLYGSCTIDRFSAVFGGPNWDVPYCFSKLLSTCKYHPQTTLYGTFAIPNLNVSQYNYYLKIIWVGYTIFLVWSCSLGPLTSSWCMRMEAKNSYFKRIAQLGNFKNIALSVARRHQKLVCAYLNDKNFFGRLVSKLSSKLAIGR